VVEDLLQQLTVLLDVNREKRRCLQEAIDRPSSTRSETPTCKRTTLFIFVSTNWVFNQILHGIIGFYKTILKLA